VRFGPGPLILVGFMGCGKSSVGPRLASLLGRRFEDSDRELERREGRTIREIIAEEGETRFRKIESALLVELCKEGVVIAAGGGAFLRFESRRTLIRTGCTVWLDASLASCRARIGEGESRPIWPKDDPLAQRVLYERRRACYALSDLRAVADAPVEQVATRLAARLQQPIP